MRRLFIILAALIMGSTAASSQTANCKQSECEGSIRNVHDDGHYKFYTTSRIYEVGDEFIYETCVQNVGERDLEVDWMIPGPKSVVPVGCAVPAPRSFPYKKTLASHSGCLQYGALWEWKNVPFHPHENDESAIAVENTMSCRDSKITQVLEGISPLRSISFSTERFGPSVYSDFDTTMSRMDFFVTVSPDTDLGVISTSIEAKFSPAYDNKSEFYSRGFEIRPSGEQGYQRMLSGARGTFSGGTILAEGEVKYEMEIPKNPVQKFIRYDVLSQGEKTVASIDIPIWVSGD